MKKLLFVLFFSPWVLSAQVAVMGEESVHSSGAAPPSYLVEENCEGTGTPADWTDIVGSPDWDYTTTVLEGSESLHIVGSQLTEIDFTAQSDVWVYFKFRAISSITDNPYVFNLQDSSNVNVARIRLITPTSIRAYNGTANTTSASSTIAVDTAYHVWLHYVKGSGSDGETTIYTSTSGTKGSAVASVTTGTATTDAVTFQFNSNTNGVIFDRILVLDSEIGDSP